MTLRKYVRHIKTDSAAWNGFGYAAFILAALLFTKGITQIDWPTQIRNGIVLDPRAYGAICDGNTGNATLDTLGIQAAMDAVQYSNGGAGGNGAAYTGHVATIVRLPVGQCTINAPLVVHKPNTVLEGSIATADGNMKSGSWLNALSTFNGPMIRMSSEDIYNYPSAGQGQNTPVIRGVALRDFGMDLTAATNSGNFTAHWAVEAFSPSDMPDWSGIWVMGQRGGCFLISTSLSSSANNVMADPEQIKIRNFMCFTNGNAPTQAGIMIRGSNETTIDTGSISIGNAGFVTPSGTNDNNNAAGVEIASDDSGNFGNHINIFNVHVTDYAVHFRVKGEDQTFVPAGQFGCVTHPHCTMASVGQTPQHYGPAWVHFSNNECESWHICLAIRPEGNPNGFSPNRVTVESSWDQSNTIYFPNSTFQATARSILVDFMQGGRLDTGARASVYASQVPIVFGANTFGIYSTLYYDPLNVISVAVIATAGANNHLEIAPGRETYVNLPRCFQSSCSVPNTDVPSGTPHYCSNCDAAASGVAPTGGTGSGRMLISNGSQWVGQ